MATAAHITSTCPRLTSDAARITTADLLALLDPPTAKRNGVIRALVIRHIPKLGSADLGLSPVLA